MTLTELIALLFAAAIGGMSFLVNRRLFTDVFQSIARNGREMKSDTVDPERSGTFLAVSCSVILAYYVWKFPHVAATIIVMVLVVSAILQRD